MITSFLSLTNRIMDGSSVTESLDSVWFYTNILTNSTYEPSLTHPFSPSSPPKTDLQSESQNIDNKTAACQKSSSSAVEEEEAVKKSERETKKRERRIRKFKKKGSSSSNNNKHEIVQMLETGQQNEMPPLDDDVAMKKHLKAWAYAVAISNEPISKVHLMNSQV